MKNKFKYLILIILLLLLVGCGETPQDNDDVEKPTQQEEVKKQEVIFLDENGSLYTSFEILEGDEFDLPEVPAKKYYSGYWKYVSTKGNKITYNVHYDLSVFSYSINYSLEDANQVFKTKNDLLKSFLKDFYDFLEAEETYKTFLYGLDMEASDYKNGTWKNYLGGSFSKKNRLIYNNDLEADNDFYFLNSTSYKNKWKFLGEYVRNYICKSNKRFGYSDIEYLYGALDFYRYLVDDPSTYIESYGGETVFYSLPELPVCTYINDYNNTDTVTLPYVYSVNFDGWYKDSSFTDGPYKELSKSIGDVTFYAKYNIKSNFNIYLIDEDENLIMDIIEAKYNEDVNLPTVEKEDATFMGWYLDETKITSFTMIYDCDLVFMGKWNNKYINDLVNLEYDGKTVYYNDSLEAVKIYEDYEEKEEGSEELRAVWVSSFVKGFTPYKDETLMKAELSKLLDELSMFNINCIFFHVRTHNNAFYKTMLAPTTSKYGDYGTYADFLVFDYLPWFIEECHKRNIELHAWLNPYRIELDKISIDATTSDVAERYENFPLNPASNPDNILLTNANGGKSGTHGAILNPAKEAVQDYLVDVIEELMNNYDIDGIHFDDYFYTQLNSTKEILDDEDQADFLYYVNSSSKPIAITEENKANWRRENVNNLIYKLHVAISEYNKTNNKSIQFGISPTFVYKKGDGSVESGANVSSFGHFEDGHYADTYLWVKNEWIDYIMPQLYTPLVYGKNNFADAAIWWDKALEGSKVNLYFGLANYKMLSEIGSWIYEDEFFNQLKYIQTLKNVKGVSLFSSTYISKSATNQSDSYYVYYKKLRDEFWTKQMVVPKSRIN